MTVTLHQDVVCAFCGCLCDDLQVEVEDNKITRVKKVCVIGRNKLLHAQENLASFRVAGEDVSLEEATNQAARILSQAKAPLIYGLSSTTAEGIREAMALAEMTKGTIDNCSSY